MQHILVTGGAGRLGRLVVKQLSKAGYPVRGMSRRANPGDDWPGAEWVRADLETGAGLSRAVQGMDVVVHAATGGNRHIWQIDVLLHMLTRLPLVALVPTDLLLQPIAEEEVARRLCEIVQAGPSGRLPDMGGPQVYTSGELARGWLRQRGMHRAILPIFLPGKTASRMRQGGNTCPQQATGTVRWEAWLQQHERTHQIG
jgi:uncharacterized protein YbjT (DUF2867 family)